MQRLYNCIAHVLETNESRTLKIMARYDSCLGASMIFTLKCPPSDGGRLFIPGSWFSYRTIYFHLFQSNYISLSILSRFGFRRSWRMMRGSSASWRTAWSGGGWRCPSPRSSRTSPGSAHSTQTKTITGQYFKLPTNKITGGLVIRSK